MKAIYLFFASGVICCSGLKAQTSFSVPFEQVRRLIVVKVAVEGTPAWFLLDTGAGDIVLNASYFPPSQTQEGFIKDSNGRDLSLSTTWIRLELGVLKRKNEKAYLGDLAHLEKALGRSIHGIIGAEFFRNTELEIDYARQLLIIYPLDRRGEPYASEASRPEVATVLPLKRKGHVLSLTARVAGKTLRFGMDTGAEVNLILKKEKGLLIKDVMKERRFAVWSFGNRPVYASGRYLLQLQVGPVEYDPMEAVIVEDIPFNYGQPGPLLDGILGYPFLSQHLTAINFAKMQVTFRLLGKGARQKTFLVGNQENRKSEEPGNFP